MIPRTKAVAKEQCLSATILSRALWASFFFFLTAFFLLFLSSANASAATISGSVYTDEGVTPIAAGKTIRLLVNGVSAGTNAPAAGGAYSITATVNAGDAILVYVDDGVAGSDGTTVTVSNGADLAGLDIYVNYVTTRHDNAGILTNANMSSAKGAYVDTEILYSVSGGALTVSSGTLYMPTGHSFSPGGNVTPPAMKSLGTFNGGANAIDINGAFTISAGSFTSTSGQMNISGATTISGGTFNHNSGTIVFDPTAAVTLNAGAAALNNVSISTAMNATLTISGTMTIAGNLTVNMTTAFNNPLSSGTLNVGGNLTITAAYSITSAINVSGNVTSTDAAVTGAGTITLNGTLDQTITAGFDYPDGGFIINKPSGTASPTGNFIVNALQMVSGTFSPGAYTLDINGPFSMSGGTFNA